MRQTMGACVTKGEFLDEAHPLHSNSEVHSLISCQIMISNIICELIENWIREDSCASDSICSNRSNPYEFLNLLEAILNR